MTLEIQPYISVGDLHFGDSRQHARQLLGSKYQSFEKVPGSNETDAYDDLGLHLYFDSQDCLEYVETFFPASPSLQGAQLLGKSIRQVADELARLGHGCVSIDSCNMQCDSAGISLHFPDGPVLAVGVFRRGYYEETEKGS